MGCGGRCSCCAEAAHIGSLRSPPSLAITRCISPPAMGAPTGARMRFLSTLDNGKPAINLIGLDKSGPFVEDKSQGPTSSVAEQLRG